VQAPSCLLLVDVQAQFLNDETRHAFGRIPELLWQFDLVIASRLLPSPGGIMQRFKRWQPAAEDSAGSALAVDLSTRARERTLVVGKFGFSAFTDEVQAWARERGVRDIHLAGGDTDMCLLRTAIAVMEAGLRPVVIASHCTSAGGPEMHEFALIQLKRLLGREQIVRL
jgi:nicotinamidase-related amidase